MPSRGLPLRFSMGMRVPKVLRMGKLVRRFGEYGIGGRSLGLASRPAMGAVLVEEWTASPDSEVGVWLPDDPGGGGISPTPVLQLLGRRTNRRGDAGVDAGHGEGNSEPKSLRKSYPLSRAKFSPTCRNDWLEIPSAKLVLELPASDSVTWFCRHSGQLNEARSLLSRQR